MARLVGKQPNYAAVIVPIVLIAAIGTIFVKLENKGTIDTIPGFGRDRVF